MIDVFIIQLISLKGLRK